MGDFAFALRSKTKGRNVHSPAPPHLIELRVDETRQLFDTLDPFPFRERDIDAGAENYIVAWARELSADAPWKIVVHLPGDQVNEGLAHELSIAFARFFRYRAETATMDLRELFRVGRISLVVGLTVLVGSVFAAQQAAMLAPAPLSRLLEESLLILGWVANWRPLEIFLYDWLPIVRRRRLFGRLANARVEIRAASTKSASPPNAAIAG